MKKIRAAFAGCIESLFQKFSIPQRLASIVSIGYFLFAGCESDNRITIKQDYIEILTQLDSTLLTLQNNTPDDPDFGSIWCPHCSVYHTRAAEAVFPFAYLGSITENEEYTRCAINVGNWLIKNQQSDGSWVETPELWTGTTTDQLLMLSLAYPILEDYLTIEQQERWKTSMEMAGEFLIRVMSPEFASINYCATSAASLSCLNLIIPDDRWETKADKLAGQVMAKLDDEYFLTGEGGRVHGVKYGVDLIYNLEMSLWGLGLYATHTGNEEALDLIRKSIDSHLHFIYPDGSMDGSWGVRSNKWTCYGGATSDGCQVLFSLFSKDDPVYSTASMRNMDFLQSCMQNGWVGYGPRHWDLLDENPCIYPTFAKAKNFALAHKVCTIETMRQPTLPSEKNGVRFFKTLNVITATTDNYTATITAYNYKDPKGASSKYMFRPSGGAVSNMLVKNGGRLQASSQTEYHRWEPMHFPEVDSIVSLTPRIELKRQSDYYTNLFEFDAKLSLSGKKRYPEITVTGELKNRNQKSSGISYSLIYRFQDNALRKTIRLQSQNLRDTIRIIEPIIDNGETQFIKTNAKQVIIKSPGKTVLFELIKGEAFLSLGDEHQMYWAPYPALKGFPIVMTAVPEDEGLLSEISFCYWFPD